MHPWISISTASLERVGCGSVKGWGTASGAPRLSPSYRHNQIRRRMAMCTPRYGASVRPFVRACVHQWAFCTAIDQTGTPRPACHAVRASHRAITPHWRRGWRNNPSWGRSLTSRLLADDVNKAAVRLRVASTTSTRYTTADIVPETEFAACR